MPRKPIRRTNEAKYCGVCNRNFIKSEYKLLCTGKCEKWVCQKCSNLNTNDIRELADKRMDWICNPCKGQDKRKSILIHESSDDNDDDGDDDEDRVTVKLRNPSNLDVIKLIERNHDSMQKEMKSLRSEVLELQQSVRSMSSTIDDLKTENHSLKDEIKFLRSDLLTLQQSAQFMSDTVEELRVENGKLKDIQRDESRKLQGVHGRLGDLEIQFEIIEQAKREKNLIIMNAPKQENENTQEMVLKIIQYLGVSIKMADFQAKRLSQKENSPILVEFKCIDIKQNIIKKRKEVRVLKMEECGYTGNKILYFNEDLTKANQELFMTIRKFKEENRFKYAWINNSRIYLRKNDGDQAIWIRKPEDLDKLKIPNN